MSQNKGLMPFMDANRRGAKVQVEETLIHAFLRARDARAVDDPIAQDAQGEPLTYDALLQQSAILSHLLGRMAQPDEQRIGLMMPTSMPMMTSFLAVQLLGRVATMLNFTAGVAAVLGACTIAQVRTVLTSRQFIERANLGLLVETLVAADLNVHYYEDLIGKIEPQDRQAEGGSEALASVRPDDPAVVLFTSGSEGAPKGVVLSHRNILSNIAQFTEQLDIGPWDKMFACLPMYHSFGLTVGTLLPLFSGVPTFFYPSPLHYHEVPRLIRETQSTLILTTDTFLTGYARMGKPEDFASLRYIIAGAEKLKDQTRHIWEGQFGKIIFEGYGVTETAPVVSVNAPDHYALGSVGRILPGIEVALHPVEGITCGAELWVRGPNIMLGYMKADAPGVLLPPKEGWHNTGDVVSIDENGFLTIKGRIKRFAKIGGEMISLVAIEQVASKVCPGVLHAVVSVPHARRGEAIVLLTEQEDFDADALRHALREHGMTELYMPREILFVSKVPVLGSGKLDFITARARAIELLSPAEAQPPAEKQAQSA